MIAKTGLAGLAGLLLGPAGIASATDAGLATTPPGTSADPETIVVYGTRLEQPVTETGSVATVVTAEDIERLGLNFAVDAIALVPGVTVNQYGPFGGLSSVRIRGASSEHTLVIVDGIVTNDPSSPGGGFDFAALDAANIERIEVLKGPQSTLWGSDAIGGVVNIVTRTPEAGMTVRAFGEGGSYSSLRAGGEFALGADRYDLRLAAVRTTTDGISKADAANGNTEADAYASTTVNLKAGLQLFGGARLAANVLYNDNDTEFDSFSFGAQGDVADGDELAKSTQVVGDVTLTLPLFDGRLENLFLAGYTDLERDNFTDGAYAYGSDGERRQYRYQGNLDISAGHRLAFGAERETLTTPDAATTLDGFFAVYEWQPADSITLTGGLRRDEHERFGGETTRRVAVAWNPLESLTVHASWGEAFKAPTLFQATYFCCGATMPNADLRPETATGWDAGVSLRTADARGEIGLTWFAQDTENLITFEFATGGYRNIAAARSRGLELSARYSLAAWVGLQLDYAYIDAEDDSGAALVRVPAHSGNVRLLMNPEGTLSGSLLLRYNGSESDPGGAVDAWTRVDLAGQYRLSEAVELYARLENLLDAEYQQVLGYGTPGRSGYLGARLRF